MACSLYDTIRFYRQFSRSSRGKLQLDFNGLNLDPETEMVATGYGKIAVTIAGAQKIPEIQAHAFGALFQSRCENFTLLDIGGQDTKVIQVQKGDIVDFATNDRCAAGSGRYLENMASVLEINWEQLSSYDQNPVELNATCAIFGETELIARIVEGHPTSHLAAGVNYAVFKRVAPLLKKLYSDTIILSGGGALNPALVRMIREETGCQVLPIKEPRLNGAIGCCVWGQGWK